jgi:hypothetical protein
MEKRFRERKDSPSAPALLSLLLSTLRGLHVDPI